jgi:hypothetical protein
LEYSRVSAAWSNVVYTTPCRVSDIEPSSTDSFRTGGEDGPVYTFDRIAFRIRSAGECYAAGHLFRRTARHARSDGKRGQPLRRQRGRIDAGQSHVERCGATGSRDAGAFGSARRWSREGAFPNHDIQSARAALLRPGTWLRLRVQPFRRRRRVPRGAAARSGMRALLLGRGDGPWAEHQRADGSGDQRRRRSRR